MKTNKVPQMIRLDRENWIKLVEIRGALTKKAGRNVSMNSIINDAIASYQLPNEGQRFIE